jgi:hypothetical protein
MSEEKDISGIIAVGVAVSYIVLVFVCGIYIIISDILT